MKTKYLLVVALLVAIQTLVFAERIKGNGKIITKEISIGDYESMSVTGSIDVVYEQKSGKPYLKVSVDENVWPYIEAEVREGELYLGFKTNENIRSIATTSYKIVTNCKELREVAAVGSARIDLKNIKHKEKLAAEIAGSASINLINTECKKLDLNVAGSGKIQTTRLNVSELEASVVGSGEVRLEGSAKEAHYEVAGSGTLKAYGCEVDTVKASVAGSGKIETKVNKDLDANVVGSGNIMYKGNPTVNTEVVGSGRIRSTN